MEARTLFAAVSVPLAATPPTAYERVVPATPRLYYDAPLLCRFASPVTAHARYGERPSVILAETAFYPEAGGQMADRGTLGGRSIADVQVDDAGVVHHMLDLVEGDQLPPIGAEVVGQIDRARRREHMSLHTGQHMLSRALLDVAGAETVSARLGDSGCTIDLQVGQPLDDRAVAAAEDLANAVIDDDVVIRAWFPTAEELAAIRLRREPKVESNIRVVEVAGFDASPCGGTHCTRSGQVGLIRVISLERYKGGWRVHFVAGTRGRRMLASHSEAMRALGHSFAVPPVEVPGAVERLRAELKAAKEGTRALQDRLGDELARGLVAAMSDDVVVAAIEWADVAVLRAIAKRILDEASRSDASRDGMRAGGARGGETVVFLAAPKADGVDVLVSRGARSEFDCGAFVKRSAAAVGGRGGGRPGHAEGKLPPGADWAALVAAR